nr:proteasome activator subunit 4 [Cryptococcus depauperatus CBS 7841]
MAGHCFSILRRAPHTTAPQYGQQALESGAFSYDDQYYEQEDFDLEEEIARLEQDHAGDDSDDDDGLDFVQMSEVWPSAVPNRLGKGYTRPGGVYRELEDPNDPRLSTLGLQLSLPYEVETLVEMDDKLDLICAKLIECIHAREFGMGFRVWDSALSIWMTMGYPMKRQIKIKLIFLYYEIIFIPGISSSLIEDVANQFITLVSDRSLTIYDLRIPWRPLFDALYEELFPHPNRLSRHSINLAPTLLNVAEESQRFFHPGDVDDILEAILPNLQNNMDSILATQAFLVHFLPITHCQKWLPVLFRLWSGLNSGLWDDQASDIMGQLAILHVDPRRSDPSLVSKIPRSLQNDPYFDRINPSIRNQARNHHARQLDVEGKVDEDSDGLTYWMIPSLVGTETSLTDPEWKGIRKDIGIFTDQQFEFIMSKCLRSLNVPVGGNLASQNSMSVTVADTRASKKVLDAKKPVDRVQSLAETIVFSMSEDSLPMSPNSGVNTPSGIATPTGMSAGKGPLGRVLAQEGESQQRRYLAGCKALDHLNQLLTSCETFFHPSNSGHWSPFLTTFLSHLSSNFLERWKSEEDPSCSTPFQWRLTPQIKRAFVLTLRGVALTAIFQKEMKAVGNAVSCLKKLGALEPDLIMPAMIERAVPSLQGLEETQRTPAVIYALSALAQPLAARSIWRAGGLYVPDILALLLPGIDLNDPSKSALVSMCISNMIDFIHMSDIADIGGDDSAVQTTTPQVRSNRALRKIERPKVEDDPNDPITLEQEDLSPTEINSRVRLATSAFRDWVPEFLGRILLLFGNLPEEGGKSGRTGGKTEQVTLQSVLHTCGGVFAALDDKLYDIALEQVIEYATTTTRANAVDAVGELVRNLAASNAPKVFRKVFPICKQKILSELKSGASGTRTTITSVPVPGDAGLHWWQSILVGCLIPGRVKLSDPAFKNDYIDLLRTMVDNTFSERGWAWTGKILEKTISSLTSIYFREMKFLSPTAMFSPDFAANHHLYWGKLYRSSEVQPQWNTPSKEDIEMAFDIIKIADEAREKIEQLLVEGRYGDKIWSNEFCRAINVIDKILRGSYNLIKEIEGRKNGEKKAPSYLPQALTIDLPTYKSGLVLADPNDLRFIYIESFRHRVGETLHRAACALRTAGQSDSSVDAVKLLVTTLGTFMTAYGVRSKQFSNSQNALSAMTITKKMFENQKKQHRTLYLATASIHHQTRLTTLAYYRKRSGLDDRLIVNMLDFCLSPFVRIRRSAQSTLDTIAKLYKGVWVLCFPTLFDALKPGTDPDIMKGALYVLRYNHIGINRIGKDWRQLLELAEHLLNAHHENKASVQALISKATDELIGRIKEPTTFDMDVGLEKVILAAKELTAQISYPPDSALIDLVHQGTLERFHKQNQQWDIFVDRILAIAKNPNLNWRYVLSAARFLLAVGRRDRPIDLRLTEFFMGNVQNALPRIRDYGVVGTTRLLFQMTLRSLCKGSEDRLFLQEPIDHFSTEIPLTNTSATFTQSYLASFREPYEDESQVVLHDRPQSGWLAWGKKIEVSRFTGWDEASFEVELESVSAKNMIGEVIGHQAWWERLSELWAQENERNYPSATHIDFILALSQIYGISIFHSIRPIIDAYLSEMETTRVYDRHKMRAMWEFLSGMLRGGIEWSGRERIEFWDWFTPKLPEIYGNIRHDTTKCWDTSIEYILCEQDPRRFRPIIDFCIQTALNANFSGASAFNLARSVQLARSVIRCLQWRFNAWADDFTKLYFKEVACPYADVRGMIASVLNAIDQLKFYPSYPSATALVSDILSDPNDKMDVMHIRGACYQAEIDQIVNSLSELKKERPHGPVAITSVHDLTATTLILWLTVELSDVHAVSAFPYVIPILPQIFELRELHDNIELQRNCGRLLAMITGITPALDLVEPLMASLISILQASTSWRTRMNVMPVLSLVYFRNLSLLSEACKALCLDVVSSCLRDPNQEVREMASVSLSGFLRCSQRAMVVVLKDRFTKEIQSINLPRRRGGPGHVNPEYQTKLVELHGAVLGASALVEAFPYTVPKFIPNLLADVLAPRVSEPPPVSTTIRSCVASFKRTHEKYQDRFSEDELSAVNYAQAGNSYCMPSLDSQKSLN